MPVSYTHLDVYKRQVYGSSAVMVNEGAFATIAISDTEIGAISADMAVEILNGKSVADIPVLEVPGTEIVVNKTTMEALGIEIDDSQGVTFVE